MNFLNLRVWGKNYLVENTYKEYDDLLCGKVIERGGGFGINESYVPDGAEIVYRRGHILGGGYSIVSAEEVVAVVIEGKADED